MSKREQDILGDWVDNKPTGRVIESKPMYKPSASGCNIEGTPICTARLCQEYFPCTQRHRPLEGLSSYGIESFSHDKDVLHIFRDARRDDR